MALNFIGKTWNGSIPHYFKPKKKTVKQPELTQKADLALHDLLHSGGVVPSEQANGFIKKLMAQPSILPGGAAMKYKENMVVGFDAAKGKDTTVVHTVASDVVGKPIPYDPKAPLEINWDALSPDVAKLVKDKQSEIEEKMVADFEAVTLNTKEMVAETHIPYAALEDNALASVDYADIENKIMAQVASIYGVPKEKVEEPDKADLVYKAFDLLKQAGVYIKSGDVHYEAKEITSGTLELDLHTFGAASAFTLALDMLTHKVKPE